MIRDSAVSSSTPIRQISTGISLRSSPALLTLTPGRCCFGKCLRLPVTRKSTLRARAQAMNLSSPLSRETDGMLLKATDSPRSRKTERRAFTSSRGNPNFGRARTSEYSCRISSEKHGMSSPRWTARRIPASFPAAEIIADTKTFVSMTARITSSSHAGRRKFRHRCRES